MNNRQKNIEAIVEELLKLLDADAAGLETTLDHLNNLRAGVIRRDESSLIQMLDNIRAQQDGRNDIENKRTILRQTISAMIGCVPEQVNLSRIMENMKPMLRQQVLERQQILSKLLTKLKIEYTATAALLGECSRFNRMLLDSIVGGRCKGVATYNATGQMKQPGGSGFVAMQL